MEWPIPCPYFVCCISTAYVSNFYDIEQRCHLHVQSNFIYYLTVKHTTTPEALILMRHVTIS